MISMGYCLQLLALLAAKSASNGSNNATCRRSINLIYNDLNSLDFFLRVTGLIQIGIFVPVMLGILIPGMVSCWVPQVVPPWPLYRRDGQGGSSSYYFLSTLQLFLSPKTKTTTLHCPKFHKNLVVPNKTLL